MIFEYKVLHNNNELLGTIETSSKEDAIDTLHKKGYVILELSARKKSLFDYDLPFFNKVKTKDLVIFTKQLSTLFSAEVSALRSFYLIAENIEHAYLKQIIYNIAQKVEQGQSLKVAFGQYEDIFGTFFVNIIAAGETSGTLKDSFLYLSEHIERTYEIQQSLKKALTYPIFVIVIFFAVMMLMFTVIIPQISTILVEGGGDLPLITKVILGISTFLQTNVVYIFILTTSAIVFGVWFGKTEDGKRTYDQLALKLPLVGKLIKEYHIITFSYNLSILLSSGVALVTSLENVEKVFTNTVYKDFVKEIGQKIKQGTSLSTALGSDDLLGNQLQYMIRTGEETGQVTKMLELISVFYQKQLDQTISTAIDLIQPTIIIFLGLGVGTLIAAIILPIYSLTNAL